MASKEKIRKIAKRMIGAQKNDKMLQAELRDTADLNWKLPSPLNTFPWVRANISTSPYDAIRGGMSALSNLEIGIDVNPATVGGDSKSQETAVIANQWEKCLKWNIRRATKRKGGFDPEVIWHDLVFHEIIAQVIHLPTQFNARKLGGVREDAAYRYGDWAIRLANPIDVYVEYSEYMPERVLSVYVKTAQEIVDYWPDTPAGKSLTKKIAGDDEFAKEKFIEFDYVDYDDRYVFVSEYSNNASSAVESKVLDVLGPEPWLIDKATGKPVPFLPWVCVKGGRPLLYPVVKAQKWANANIMQTIEMSTAIAEAAAPRDAVKGVGSENVEIDHGWPGGRVDLTAYQTWERIQQLGLDPQMREASDIIEAAIRQTTVADILVTGQPMGGVEAVSGYNLQLQTAIASLGPYREIGEQFYDRILETMLLIAYYRGADIEGQDYTISATDIDPKNIYVSTELKTDVPADRIQRVTAANQMAQNLNYPMARILPMLGETDPEGAIEQWKIEQYQLADWMGRVQRRQMEQSGEIQQMAQEMAQGMIQQQMQQQPMSPEQSGAMGNPPNLGAPPGMEGVEGQGFNPAMGGTPPIMAGAGATFEGAMGRTRGGEELA